MFSYELGLPPCHTISRRPATILYTNGRLSFSQCLNLLFFSWNLRQFTKPVVECYLGFDLSRRIFCSISELDDAIALGTSLGDTRFCNCCTEIVYSELGPAEILDTYRMAMNNENASLQKDILKTYYFFTFYCNYTDLL